MKFRHFYAPRACVALACVAAFPAMAEPTLPTVVVTATRSELPVTDVVADVSIVDRDAIERSGASALVDVLARVPGVTINRNGGPASASSVYLRGAETRFTAVFVDGVRVDSQSTGGASWHAIPLAQVDRIEILRGPAAAIYGSDALAGVVQIFTKEGEAGFFPSVHFGLGSHNTRDASVSLRGGQGTLGYALGVSGDSSDGFNAQPAANPDRDGHRNRSVSGRLVWTPVAGQKLEATLLDNHQKAAYDGYLSTDNDQSQQVLRTLGLTWSAAWSDAWNTRLGVTRSKDRYETTPTPYLTETQIDTYLLRNEWHMGAATVTADLERREDQLTNDYTTPSNTQRSQNALALGYTLRHGAHTLQLNARRDDDSEFGSESTGAVAYALAVAPTLRATVSAGTAFRVPTLFQRFSYYGTPDLKAETSRNVEAGLRYQSGHDSAGFTLYRNDVKDLINYVAGPGSCANGVGDYAGCYGNAGRARYSGMTLTGGTRVAGINLGASVDVMRPKSRDTGLLLARRAKHQATLTADTLAAGWQLGGEVQYLGARFNDAANTQKLAGYSLLNLTASKAISADWRLQARVDNLTDKAYQSVLGYATAGRTFYVGLNWSPR